VPDSYLIYNHSSRRLQAYQSTR